MIRFRFHAYLASNFHMAEVILIIHVVAPLYNTHTHIHMHSLSALLSSVSILIYTTLLSLLYRLLRHTRHSTLSLDKLNCILVQLH